MASIRHYTAFVLGSWQGKVWTCWFGHTASSGNVSKFQGSRACVKWVMQISKPPPPIPQVLQRGDMRWVAGGDHVIALGLKWDGLNAVYKGFLLSLKTQHLRRNSILENLCIKWSLFIQSLYRPSHFKYLLPPASWGHLWNKLSEMFRACNIIWVTSDMSFSKYQRLFFDFEDSSLTK